MSVFQAYLVMCDECCELLGKSGAVVVSDTPDEAEDAAAAAGWTDEDDGEELFMCKRCREERAKDGAP